MKSFTVHERPDPASDRIERGEGLVFVQDGFSWGAALFGAVWLAGARLWLPLLGYVLTVAVLLIILQLAAVAPAAQGVAFVGLAVWLGFEAASLRRWGLERDGWQIVGTVQGRTRAECERRFFDTWRTEPARGHGQGAGDWSRGDIAEANAVLEAATTEPRGSWWPFGASRGARS